MIVWRFDATSIFMYVAVADLEFELLSDEGMNAEFVWPSGYPNKQWMKK